MSSADFSNNQQFNIELEKGSDFLKVLLVYMVHLLLIKKFGETFYNQYVELQLEKLNGMGEHEDYEPMIAEIDVLAEKAYECVSLDQLIALAEINGVKFTENEINAEKRKTITDLMRDSDRSE